MSADHDDVTEALKMMRTKDRVVRVERDRGELLIEAETYRSSGQELVDRYVLRWLGDDLLGTYWTEDNVMAIQNELVNRDFDVVKKCDVDLPETQLD